MGIFSGSKPKTQYYGGSLEAYERAGRDARANAAIAREGQFVAREGLQSRAGTESRKLENLAARSGDFAASNRDVAQSTTSQVLRGAADLERLGARAARDYQQTAQAQFAAQQDANQRAALSMGAVGGASGVRSALAASSQANAQAANQAAIIQAQELNNIRQQEQNAVLQAAGLRGNVAQLGTQAALASAQQQMAGQQAASGMAFDAGKFEAASAQDLYKTEAELGQNIEMAQLNARREREAQRQNWKKSILSQGSLGLIK